MRARNHSLKILLIVGFYTIFQSGTALAGEPTALDPGAYPGKVVVVDFWASWCVPCRRSLPWLAAMQLKYADDGLVVLAVNEDKDADAAHAFLEETPVSLEIIADGNGDIATAYGLVAMPSTYVYGRDGTLVARHLGFRVAETDEYEAILRTALDADD